MSGNGEDHERQTAKRPPDNEEERPEPADPGTRPHRSRLQKALATAQNLVDSAEQSLVLFSAVSTTETDTALVAVKATRAVLYLAQLALSSLQKSKR